MLDFLGNLKRTHYCGALRASDAGTNAIVMGWVHRRRDLGKVIFIHLRDQDWIDEHLRDLGAMHWRAGVTPEMYPWIKDSVLAVLEEGMAPSGWNLRCQREWAAALDVIAQGMLMGYPRADGRG